MLDTNSKDTRRRLVVDILTRISRTMGREGDSYGSEEVQLSDCRDWSERKGHRFGMHHHEENVSGGALLHRRHGLQAAIDRLRSGKADAIVVRSVDRFMRSVELSWAAIRLIEGRGEDEDGNQLPRLGRLFAVHGDFDIETPEGKFRFTVMQSVAEYQRDIVARDWHHNRLRRFEAGVYLARAPLGYRKLDRRVKEAGPWADGYYVDAGGLLLPVEHVDEVVAGGLVVDPAVGPVMRELFERAAAGAAPADLARWLTEATGRPRSYDPSVVRKMLRNRAYVGEQTFRYRDDLPLVRPAAHRPIIDEALCEAAQRARPVGTTQPTRRERALLTGFLRCAHCRYILKPHRNQHGYPSYECRQRDCGVRPYVNARHVEELLVEAAFCRHEVMLEAVEVDETVDKARARVAIAERNLATFTKHNLSKIAGLDEALAELSSELAGAQRELAEALHRRSARVAAPRALRTLWADLDADARRRVLKLIVDRVVVRGPGATLADRLLILGTGEEQRYERRFGALPGRGRAAQPLAEFAWDRALGADEGGEVRPAAA
jgi:DNA invertase Pin-like site-specific DNA recombinase